MKKSFFVLLLSIITVCCSDNKINNNNPNIPNYTFSVDVDLSLPLYSTTLAYAGNGTLLTQQGAGVRGVIVFNTGSGFVAYDAACPNQAISACSTMTISGINATCPCDNKKYSLYTGLSSGQQYPMKAYRTEVIGNGSVVRVFN